MCVYVCVYIYIYKDRETISFSYLMSSSSSVNRPKGISVLQYTYFKFVILWCLLMLNVPCPKIFRTICQVKSSQLGHTFRPFLSVA